MKSRRGYWGDKPIELLRHQKEFRIDSGRFYLPVFIVDGVPDPRPLFQDFAVESGLVSHRDCLVRPLNCRGIDIFCAVDIPDRDSQRLTISGPSDIAPVRLKDAPLLG